MAPQQEQHDDDERPVVLFVHGMYGSHLVDTASHNKLLWISPWTVLKSIFKGNKGHTQVAAPLTWSQDGLHQDQDSIKPESIVTQFTKTFSDWTQTLQDNHQAQVLNFLWDWRRPLEESTSKLLEYLDQQGLVGTKRRRRRRVVIVSYSTGSLLAWVAINKYPQTFQGWVSVGAAMGCGNFMLHDFAEGWSVGAGIQLLDPETILSCPSIFSFFSSGTRARIQRRNIQHGKPYRGSLGGHA